MTTNIHPLMIDHILQQIFQLVFWSEAEKSCRPVADSTAVKSVRLVCKHWNLVATRLFRRKRAQLCFQVEEKRATLATFMKVVKHSSVIPAESYQIPSEFFWDGLQVGMGNEALFLDFLRVCGPCLVKLSIELAAPCRVTSSSPMELPTLTQLRVVLETVTVHQRKKNELLTFLLKAAINLRDLDLVILLELRGDLMTCRAFFHESLLRTVISNLAPSTRALCFSGVMLKRDSTLLDLLSDKNLRLEAFYFQWVNPILSESLERFLETQGSTLKQLALGKLINPWTGTPVLSIPPLPHLEVLSLQFIGRLPPITSGFPRLCKLDAKNFLTEDPAEFLQFLESDGNLVNHPLKEIRLPSFVSADVVTVLGMSFSCLTQLSYWSAEYHRFSDFVPVAQAVFQHCLNLEQLQLHYNVHPGELPDNMDSLLSGIPERLCSRLRLWQAKDLETLDVTPFQRCPAITNLKKLRRLRLEKLSDNQIFVITPISAALAFLRMDSLKELKVDFGKFHRCFTPEMGRQLMTRFGIHTGEKLEDVMVE